MDFVSLLGGIVLGAAGAAILDSKTGGVLGEPPPAPAPQVALPMPRTVRVRTPERTPRPRAGYPVVNRIGGMMR